MNCMNESFKNIDKHLQKHPEKLAEEYLKYAILGNDFYTPVYDG